MPRKQLQAERAQDKQARSLRDQLARAKRMVEEARAACPLHRFVSPTGKERYAERTLNKCLRYRDDLAAQVKALEGDTPGA